VSQRARVQPWDHGGVARQVYGNDDDGGASAMMPKLRLVQHARSARSAWPPFEEQPATPLFLGRQQYRKLVVLLDADVLAAVDLSTWSKEWLLAGLLTLDVVECVRYADDGPPDDAPRENNDFMGESIPGWAVLGPDEHDTGIRSVRTVDGNQISDHGIMGNGPDVAAQDTRTDAYSDREPAAASQQRRADALAAMVANAIGADVFIMNRAYLHAMSWNVADGVTYLDIDRALAVLGLYLRAQQVYVTSRSPQRDGSHTMNRGLFFWVGTRELLPSAWRWFAACVQHSTGSGSDSLIYLGQSVLQRVQRALQVRDDVHVGLNKPQNNDTADEALSSLDVVLLLLMGAVDATARVTHTVLGLTSRPYRAGWQNQDWLAEVEAAASTLGGLFQSGTDEVHTLTILRLLRNAIHGEALQPLGVGRGRQRDRTLVSLPSAQQADLLAGFAALGGNAYWGIEQLVPGRIHADPGVLLEQLLPRVLRMLNDIMAATPVEQLPHVNLQPSDLQPPVGSHSGPFVELNRQSIRWQLGL